MSELAQVVHPVAAAGTAAERVIARYGNPGRGPLLISIAGIHGNEPAGIHASRRVFAALREKNAELQGEWLALVGNVGALAVGSRFLRGDLNQLWTPERVKRLRAHADLSDLIAEDADQMELLRFLDSILSHSRSPIYFVDLHTTSADGAPFAIVEDSLPNRRFAFKFPMPLILGLEEEIGGTLMDYLTEQGHITITFQGGQHNSPLSIEHHEALLWLAFEACGLITRKAFQEVAASEAKVHQACSNTRGAFEMRYRHAILPNERFRMKPGLCNFDPVSKHQVVAFNRWGPVEAPMEGRIIMPLYQELGADGFFLGREISPFWLRFSALLRRLRLDKLASWLPGVRRHPHREGFLLVDPGIARWFEVEIFHLLGFRRHPPEGKYLVFSPRKYDFSKEAQSPRVGEIAKTALGTNQGNSISRNLDDFGKETWRAAEALSDASKIFVLWMVKKRICVDHGEFTKHFGKDLPSRRLFKELRNEGFLFEESGKLVLTGLGENALSYLNEVETK